MVELPKINDTDELNAAIAELKPILQRHSRYRKPASQPSFQSIALGKAFRAEKAVPIILEQDPSYPGMAEVLFLGFCGWVVSPSDDSLGLALMSHGVLDHLAEAEKQARLLNDFQLQADIYARYVLVGPDFLSDIYYAFRGHEGFSYVPTRPELEAMFLREKRSLQTLVKASQLLHFSIDHLNDRSKYRRASLTTIIEVLSALRDDELVERTGFYEIWGSNRSTLALLYAASTISHRGLTLLDCILSAEVRAIEFLPTFNVWIRRARYFCDHVLKNLGIQTLTKENIKPLKTTPGLPFDSPDFDQSEIDFFKKKFRLNQ
jgi:hypothetical protein